MTDIELLHAHNKRDSGAVECFPEGSDYHDRQVESRLSIDDDEIIINSTFIDDRGVNIETSGDSNEKSNINITRNNRNANRTN